MFKRIFSIALAVILQCTLPLAHANSADAQAEAHVNSTDVQADMFYATENTAGSILPHFLNNPGFGGGVSVAHSTDVIDFNASFRSIQTYLRNRQSSLNGHTGLSVGIGKKVSVAYLSARQSYRHTAQGNDDFFKEDMYETVLKAELASGTQRPYIFAGLMVPAYVPIEQVIGMGGFGFMNHIPIYSGVGWNTGIHTNTFIATSLLSVGRESETVMRSRVAVQTQIESIPLKVDLGFHLFQDIQREEYKIWWDIILSYSF